MIHYSHFKYVNYYWLLPWSTEDDIDLLYFWLPPWSNEDDIDLLYYRLLPWSTEDDIDLLYYWLPPWSTEDDINLLYYWLAAWLVEGLTLLDFRGMGIFQNHLNKAILTLNYFNFSLFSKYHRSTTSTERYCIFFLSKSRRLVLPWRG